MTPHPDGLDLLRSRYPHWEIWRGTSQLLYARLADTRQPPVIGEDETDLADQMNRVDRC